MRAFVIFTLFLGMLSMNSAAARDFPGAGRLKFKQGPVCMCDKGLSEKDIREAEAAREQAGRSGMFNRLNQNESSQKAERRSDEEK